MVVITATRTGKTTSCFLLSSTCSSTLRNSLHHQLRHRSVDNALLREGNIGHLLSEKCSSSCGTGTLTTWSISSETVMSWCSLHRAPACAPIDDVTHRQLWCVAVTSTRRQLLVVPMAPQAPEPPTPCRAAVDGMISLRQYGTRPTSERKDKCKNNRFFVVEQIIACHCFEEHSLQTDGLRQSNCLCPTTVKKKTRSALQSLFPNGNGTCPVQQGLRMTSTRLLLQCALHDRSCCVERAGSAGANAPLPFTLLLQPPRAASYCRKIKTMSANRRIT